MDDIRSRGFASTRRYSGEYLIHVAIRGGRKLHAKLRGRGGRGQGIPETREIPASVDRESVPLPGNQAGMVGTGTVKRLSIPTGTAFKLLPGLVISRSSPGTNRIGAEMDLCKARTLAGPQWYDHDGTRSIEESARWSQAATNKWQFH